MRHASISPSLALSTLLATLVPVAASAQSPTLGRVGGGIPGVAAFPIQGQSGGVYALILSTTEQQTTIPGLNITFDVGLELLNESLSLPTFVGVLSGSGSGSPSVTLPDVPQLEGITLSLQALTISSNGFETTNFVRLTPQRVGTFVEAPFQPPLPIQGGAVASAPDGNLLFVGGTGPVALGYDPRTEEWELAGASLGVGLLSQATALPDGRVLFTGGLGLDGQPTENASLYDPSTQQTTQLTMNSARAGHGASLLGDGRVLVTGGFDSFDLTDPLAFLGAIRNTSEFFDPATGTFVAGPNMLEARALHTSTTLTNGTVLIAGGLTLLPIVNLPTVSATAYRFNPSTGSFGLPALMNGARFFHSAAPLSDGTVLLAGGLTLDLTQFLQTGDFSTILVGTRDDAQIFSTGLFGFGTFTTVNGLQQGRAGAAIAPLPNGGALVAGGFELTLDIPNSSFALNPTTSADVLTRGPNAFAPTGSMATARVLPLSVSLPDGTVMIVGGGTGPAEIYQR
jgi:hypothetical protein